MDYAPIVVFAYNRPDHLQDTIRALQLNPEAEKSALIVFSDGPKKPEDEEKVAGVRRFVSSITGFQSVRLVAAPTNKGLARSVIEGVTQVMQEKGEAIILEDDLLCTKDFLSYMNAALQKYKTHADIISISGYSFGTSAVKTAREDTALVFRASSLGWGTWKDRWDKVDWRVEDFSAFLRDTARKNALKDAGEDILPMIVKQQRGIINSWAVRWTYHHVKYGGYCLIPRYSKIKTIGDDGSGSNPVAATLKNELHFGERAIHLPDHPTENLGVRHYIRRNNRPSLYRKFLNFYRYGIW